MVGVQEWRWQLWCCQDMLHAVHVIEMLERQQSRKKCYVMKCKPSGNKSHSSGRCENVVTAMKLFRSVRLENVPYCYMDNGLFYG